MRPCVTAGAERSRGGGRDMRNGAGAWLWQATHRGATGWGAPGGGRGAMRDGGGGCRVGGPPRRAPGRGAPAGGGGAEGGGRGPRGGRPPPGRLRRGAVVYFWGVLYRAGESVYRRVVEKGVVFPASVRTLTNVNFHCSPAATVRPDGTHAVEAVTATASFRFGKSMSRWFERSGARVVVGKAGLTELAYREWFVPHGAIYLTTVGYGMGAAYGRCIKRVVDVHWLAELGIAQALWVLEVERLGPFLVEGDREGKSLFAVANQEINLRLEEGYPGLPPYAMGRFGETTARTDEII